MPKPEIAAQGLFGQYMGHVPAAFAVMSGARHTLVYANSAFRSLFAPDAELLLGQPVSVAFGGRDTSDLVAQLDRAYRTGTISRDRRMGAASGTDLPLSCTIWPDLNAKGEAEHLIVELRAATGAELSLQLQREVAERLLLAALRESDAADSAELSRRNASFLAGESRRLAESLDEEETLRAMARLSLPSVGAWCVVDTLDENAAMHRLAIVHPDPERQVLLEALEGCWCPALNDRFGLPAALRTLGPTIVAEDLDKVIAASEHDPAVLEVIAKLGVGHVLTVPLVVDRRLIGAVTFIGARGGRQFTPGDIGLAENLASRSAMALDRARLYGEAVALRIRADAASQAKTAFLGRMSHELRTPLNAIGGYVDLIEMGIHGPVSDAQRVALSRIRNNQRHLLGLISEVLDFTKVGGGYLAYDVGRIVVQTLLEQSVALVEPLILGKQLSYEAKGRNTCDPGLAASGDPGRVNQILVNLLSNSIKFTQSGGSIAIECEANEDSVHVHVSDTGIGVPDDKLEAIFEPFVQVSNDVAGGSGGIGLGLSISRSLARAMHGDLTVQSSLGKGSRFTLTLPRAVPEPV